MAKTGACRSNERPRQWIRAAAGAAGLCALLAALPLSAHRAPGSLSTLEFNPQTGNTEIVHRLHSHDAELGVGAALDLPALSVLTLEGRAHIALYVEDRFRLEARGEPLLPSLVGAELAGDYLLVYQELAGRLPATLRLRSDILRDVFPEQINQVNIDVDGTVRSLVFSNDDGWKRFADRASP